MKKIHLLASSFLLSFAALAQVDFGGGDVKKKEEPKDTAKKSSEKFWDWSKMRIGGGLGLNFGKESLIMLSPTFGYRFTKRYEAGVGVTYIYYQNNYFNPPFVKSIYGGSIYSKYNIYKEFAFAYGEYQALNSDWNYFTEERFFIYNIWVGGGINYPLGARSVAYIMVLYNINDSEYSPFSNPDIRLGIGIGF